MPDSLRGIIGFPITPFHDDLSLNLAALEENVAEIVQHPFCAINAPAGISEVFSLSPGEAVEIVRKTAEVTAGRMPVFGSACYSTPIAIEMARGMEKAGADALLVLPPYYANAPMEGLIAYYQAVGNACGLPLAVYSRGWAVFSPEDVARLAEAVPSVRFWKDGQGDARNYRRIMARVGDRLTWIGGVGDDCAASYVSIGIEIFTSSISAVAPRLALAWGEAALKRDLEALNRILDRCVHPLFAIRTRKRGYEVAAMKKLRELLGKPAGPVRPPLPELAEADVEDLKAVLRAWEEYLA